MEDLTGLRVAVFAFLVVASAWASYWPKIKAMAVPRRLTVYQLAMMTGLCLGLWSFTLGLELGGKVLAGTAIFGATGFLFLSLISGLPQKPIKVGVGDRILEFDTPDADGLPFSLSAMNGQAYLLKFYRGHW